MEIANDPVSPDHAWMNDLLLMANGISSDNWFPFLYGEETANAPYAPTSIQSHINSSYVELPNSGMQQQPLYEAFSQRLGPLNNVSPAAFSAPLMGPGLTSGTGVETVYPRPTAQLLDWDHYPSGLGAVRVEDGPKIPFGANQLHPALEQLRYLSAAKTRPEGLNEPLPRWAQQGPADLSNKRSDPYSQNIPQGQNMRPDQPNMTPDNPVCQSTTGDHSNWKGNTSETAKVNRKKKIAVKKEKFHHQNIGQLHPKPTYSYSTLIALALKNSRYGRLTVSEIYRFTSETFPYFQTAPDGWKNSIRHNLCLNKCFEKIVTEVRSSNSRKGCLWRLNPTKLGKIDSDVARYRAKDPTLNKLSLTNPDCLDAVEQGSLGISWEKPEMNPEVMLHNKKHSRDDSPRLQAPGTKQAPAAILPIDPLMMLCYSQPIIDSSAGAMASVEYRAEI